MKVVRLFTVETDDEFVFNKIKYKKTGRKNTGECIDVLTGEDVVIPSMSYVEIADKVEILETKSKSEYVPSYTLPFDKPVPRDMFIEGEVINLEEDIKAAEELKGVELTRESINELGRRGPAHTTNVDALSAFSTPDEEMEVIPPEKFTIGSFFKALNPTKTEDKDKE